MYLYEELDLSALLDDPEIDPDTPEALYAAAQCYRLGKGTPVNEALYEDTLCLAASKGSEAAQKELAARESGAGQPAHAEPEKPRALYEMFRLAEEGDPAALLEMAQYSRENGSAQDECEYLLRAAELVSRGAYSAQQGQEIYIRLGELYATQPLENPGESNRCYGMACELGSTAAMLVLADQSARGYGCQKSAEQARAWKLRAAERGTPEMKYQVALELAPDAQTQLRARALLDEVIHTAPDEALRAKARVWLELWENGGTLGEANIEAAWTMREDPEIAQQLTELYEEASKDRTEQAENADRLFTAEDQGITEVLHYKKDGENAWVGPLRLTAERAEWLWKRPIKFRRRLLWARAAQDLGSAEATGFVKRYDASCSLYEQAEQAYREQNYGQAAGLFRKAAEQGNVDAANRLALMYHTGTGVPEDSAEAGRWWNAAINVGSGCAAYNRALYLQLIQDQRDMMRKAAEWDDVNALSWLVKHAGEKTTEEWARERLVSLALEDNVFAQLALALMHDDYRWKARAIAPRDDLSKGLKQIDLRQYLQLRASLASDYFNLVTSGMDTAGAFAFTKDTYEEFLECRSQLSRPLDTSISKAMADCYKYGTGTSKDPAKAIEIYRNADERYENCAEIWYALAGCYLDGIGVEADPDQAEALMKTYAEKTNYRDSPLQKRIDEIRSQEQAAREEAEREQAKIALAKKKKQRRIMLAAGAVVLVIAAVLLRIWREQTFYRPTYLEAVSLMEQGAYDAARSAFDSISGYKDSAEKIEQCNELQYGPQYDEASALMAAGDYENAIEIFETLKAVNYRDTSAEIAQCGRGIFAGTWLGESGGTMILYKDLTCRRISRDGSVYVGTWDIANGSLTVQTNGRYLLGDEFYSVLDNGYLSTSVFMQSDDSYDHYWVDDTFTKEDHSKVFEQSEGNLKASLAGTWVGDSGDRFILREDMTCGYVSDTNSTGIGIWDVTDSSLSVQFSVDPYEIHCELENGFQTTSALFETDTMFWGSETFTKDPAENSETDREAFREALAGTWSAEGGYRFILSKNLICVYFDFRHSYESGAGIWDVVEDRLIFRPRDSDSSSLGITTYRGHLDNGALTSSVVIYDGWSMEETFAKESSGEPDPQEQAQKALLAGTWQTDAGSRLILSEDSICSYVSADGSVYIGAWEVTDGRLILDLIFAAECFGDLENGYLTTSVLLQSDAYYWKDKTFTKCTP